MRPEDRMKVIRICYGNAGNVVTSKILSYLKWNSGRGPLGHRFSGGQTEQGLPAGGLKMWMPRLVKTRRRGTNAELPLKAHSAHVI